MAIGALPYQSNQPDPSNSLPPPTTRDAALAVTAGFLGWTLDAFDFFLVTISAPRIAQEFHVDTPSIMFSVMLTLMFRPVGAFIFGLLADRYGRRVPMMANLIFYSAVEVATAFAPNLTVFLILRALFGIGMGGEWGVGTSLVMEKVPPRWRGILSGILQEGYAAGYLIAAIVAYFLLDRFGWRKLFILGGAPALLALFVRFAVRESEIWRKTKARNWTHLRVTLMSHWKIWIYLTLLMAMMNLSSHGTQDTFPDYLKKFRGFNTQQYSRVVALMMVGAIFGGVTFGLASDWFGRRKMMVVAFVGALTAIPFWAFSAQPHAIIIGAIWMQFMVQGAWGIVPAHISELSPDSVRGFLPGFSYQCGNLIAASIAYVQSSLAAKHYSYSHILSISAAIIFILAIVVILRGPEKRAMVFGAD